MTLRERVAMAIYIRLPATVEDWDRATAKATKYNFAMTLSDAAIAVIREAMREGAGNDDAG